MFSKRRGRLISILLIFVLAAGCCRPARAKSLLPTERPRRPSLRPQRLRPWSRPPNLPWITEPRPVRAPITAQRLADRLDTLEGKTIAVIANYNGSMPAIAEELLNTAKDIKVIFVSDLPVARGQSPRPTTLDDPIINMALADFEADPTVADALVFGNGF